MLASPGYQAMLPLRFIQRWGTMLSGYDLGPSFGRQVLGGGVNGQQFPAWRHGRGAMIGSRSTTDVL